MHKYGGVRFHLAVNKPTSAQARGTQNPKEKKKKKKNCYKSINRMFI